jgi:glycine oxidase
VGGGAVGLTLAVRAVQAGARTSIYTLNGLTESASGVAAGMLAPAFEAALDPVSGDHFELLRRARDAWPDMIAALDLPPTALDRSGAVRVGRDEDAASLVDLQVRLQTLGAISEPLDAKALGRLRPELSPKLGHGVFTSEDWRIDPVALLAALGTAYDRSGGRRLETTVSLDGRGRFVADGEAIAADILVLAAGPGALAWRDVVPELAALHPIKGQILTYDAAPRAGPVVRASWGYVAPQPGGAMAGATMEIGRTDVATDLRAAAHLRMGAIDLFPHLVDTAFRARAGVRLATSDGLPLVGASYRAGVHLAVGVRRNGWLLAPLIARVILDEIAGAASPDAGPLRASRFMP